MNFTEDQKAFMKEYLVKLLGEFFDGQMELGENKAFIEIIRNGGTKDEIMEATHGQNTTAYSERIIRAFESLK